jgi:rhomboid family protein
MSGTIHYHGRRSFSFGGGITYAVQRIILLNIIVFAAQLILYIPLGRATSYSAPSAASSWLMSWLAFDPNVFMRGALWQPFTYMFLHVGLWHLFMNMIGLYFFGPTVERVLSTRQFFRFYVICGVVAVLVNLIPSGVAALMGALSNAPTSPRGGREIVGASGAAMAILVAFAVADPEREVFLFPLPFPVNARALVIFFLVLNLIYAANPASMTSWETHLGGMAVGYGYMKIAPRWRAWVDQRQRRRAKPGDPMDAIGDAVDNIFEFDREKRRRR